MTMATIYQRWWDARDTFLGLNRRVQHLGRGLAEARALVREWGERAPDDAAWLCGLGLSEETSVDEAREVFLRAPDEAAGRSRGRALCFAALVGKPSDEARVLAGETMGFALLAKKCQEVMDAARLGYPLACGIAHSEWNFNFQESTPLLRRAYESEEMPEPEILAKMGLLTILDDKKASMEFYVRAATCFHVRSMEYLGEEVLGRYDPQRYFWLGRAELHSGQNEGVVFLLVKAARELVPTRAHPVAKCLFWIGKALLLEEGSDTLFGRYSFVKADLEVIRYVSRMYRESIVRVRRSIETFMMINWRLHLVSKDVLGIIVRLVWAERDNIGAGESEIVRKDDVAKKPSRAKQRNTKQA